jgi:hypothetical protein
LQSLRLVSLSLNNQAVNPGCETSAIKSSVLTALDFVV